jgi:hypothetical protein
MVVFSHNKCYAIGMFQSQQEGYLFDEDFYWHVWRSVAQQLGLAAQKVTTRMQQWSKVDLGALDPPYGNNHILNFAL